MLKFLRSCIRRLFKVKKNSDNTQMLGVFDENVLNIEPVGLLDIDCLEWNHFKVTPRQIARETLEGDLRVEKLEIHGELVLTTIFNIFVAQLDSLNVKKIVRIECHTYVPNYFLEKLINQFGVRNIELSEPISLNPVTDAVFQHLDSFSVSNAKNCHMQQLLTFLYIPNIRILSTHGIGATSLKTLIGEWLNGPRVIKHYTFNTLLNPTNIIGILAEYGASRAYTKGNEVVMGAIKRKGGDKVKFSTTLFHHSLEEDSIINITAV